MASINRIGLGELSQIDEKVPFYSHTAFDPPPDGQQIPDYRHSSGHSIVATIRIWYLDIAAALFSIACILVNVAVLYSINGRPYDTLWTHSVNITPNTLVSIISTLSKASLLLPVTECISQLKWIYFQDQPRRVLDLQTFDDASRGPLGAIRMIWITRGQAMLAATGGFIMVFALATEPFTQQILSLPVKATVATNVTASIGAARAFDDGFTPEIAADPDNYSYAASQVELNTAVPLGLFGSSVQNTYQCSSGNCHWPEFDSLGLCSQCSDVSEQVSINCNDQGHVCTYDVPSGAQFWNVWGRLQPVSNSSNSSNASFFPTTNINASVDLDPSMLGGQGQLGNFSTMRFHHTYHAGGDGVLDANNTRPQAFFCQLDWCVKTYSESKVKDGNLTDTPTSISSLIVDRTSCNQNTNFLCNASKGDLLSGKSTTSPAANTSDIKYLLNLGDMFQFQLTFKSLFSQKYFEPVSKSVSFASEIPDMYWQEWREWGAGAQSSPSIYTLAQALYYINDGDISKTLETAATSVTNRIRSNDNATLIEGSVELPVAHVHVNWNWMILPAALPALAVLLLLATVLISRKPDRLRWNSSILPLLFHGIQGWDAEGLNVRETRDMRKHSRAMRVQLADEGGRNLAFRRS